MQSHQQKIAFSHRGPFFLILIALLGAAACAPVEERADSGAFAGAGLRIDQVRDFRVLDNRNMLLYAPTRRDAWHVELATVCIGLRSTDGIELRGRTGRLAGYAGDRVVVDGAGGPEECYVRNVSRLDEAGLEALLASFGLGGDPEEEGAADESS